MSNTIFALSAADFAPLRAAQQWLRDKSTCAFDALSRITSAGTATSQQAMQSTPSQVAKAVHVSPPLSSSSNSANSLPSLAENADCQMPALPCSPSVVCTHQPTHEEIVVQRLCTDPYQFHTEMRRLKTDTNLFTKILTFITLCPCPKLDGASRSGLEKDAIELLTHSCPNDVPLTIVSIGPGGCFQEMVYLAKLANAGYKTINLILIDPKNLDKQERVLASFSDIYLPECEINIYKYDDLETYNQAAQNTDDLTPNLLLLLDLTDAEYEVNSKSLPDHAFELLQTNGILLSSTVITYSTISKGLKGRFFPKSVSCSYDGQSTHLSDIQSNRKESLVYPNGIEYLSQPDGTRQWTIC